MCVCVCEGVANEWVKYCKRDALRCPIVSGMNVSESLCRDGMETRWQLQWMYMCISNYMMITSATRSELYAL